MSTPYDADWLEADDDVREAHVFPDKPARRPVDDALDRLGNGLRATAESLGMAVGTQWFADLATVREALERSRAGEHMCFAHDADTGEEGWRPCPPDLCEAETLAREVERLREEREGYKRDFLAALERSEIQETRLRALQEAVSEYIAYPTLAGRRERLELILADLNPDGGSKGFSGGA